MCVRSGLGIPTSIKLDLLSNYYRAANKAFRINTSYEQYLALCYNYMIGRSEIPRCIISTEVRLICVKVCEWESFQKVQFDIVRQFYLHCIILLSVQKQMNDFQNYLEKIIIILCSKIRNQFNKNIFG